MIMMLMGMKMMALIHEADDLDNGDDDDGADDGNGHADPEADGDAMMMAVGDDGDDA